MMLKKLHEKISELLEDYNQIDWGPAKPNSQPNEFITNLNHYLAILFQTVQMINPDLAYTYIYQAFKFINDSLMQILLSKNVKHFNIVGIKNLRTDLVCMFECIGTKFSQYPNLMECLREIS